MKGALVLLLTVMLGLVETGCWNRREMNELGIVSATAIDRNADDHWIISYQVIIPRSTNVIQGGGGGGTQSPVTVFSSKGRTLLEAVENARREAPRSLFFAHNRIIVISQKVAERGMNQVVDFYLKHYERRETTNTVLFAGEGRKLLEVITPLENISGIAMFYLLNGRGEMPANVVQPDMHEFIYQLSTPPTSAALQEIKISGKREEQISLDALKESRSSAVIKLDRVGVFKKDKLAGWLTREESLGIAWVNNPQSLKNSVVVFPCGDKPKGSSEDLSSYLIQQVRTHVSSRMSGDGLSVNVKIDVKGILLEMPCNLDLKQTKTLSDLEKRIEKEIAGVVTRTFQAEKRLKADVLGFGDKIRKTNPKVWREQSGNWENQLDKLQMNVTVKATITRTGMSDSSLTQYTGNQE